MRNDLIKKSPLAPIWGKAVCACAAFALALSFMPAGANEAFAESIMGSNGWKVSFDGSSMESNFADGRFDEQIAGLQPGDTVTFNVDLDNNASGSTDWYMSNAVLKTLEETQNAATGGAYTYKLTYSAPNGEQNVLYDSNEVGGETDAQLPTGLHQATDALKDFFFLDELQNGDSGTVTLDVALDGETQGNSYQDTFAQLQLNFAAETAAVTSSSSSSSSSDSSGTPTTTPAGGGGSLQQTGDEMLPWMYVFAGIGLAGLILLILAFIKARRNGEER